MNRLAVGAFKLVLLAYPADFRREYGDAMAQLILDRHHQEDASSHLLVLGELLDAVRTAPMMRWESPMNRMAIIAIGATIALAVALAASPLALAPIAAAALGLGFWWFRQNRPIAPARSSRHGIAWLAAGITGLAIGIAIPTLDGGELNEVMWTAMAVCLLAGVGGIVTGTILTATDHSRPPGSASAP